MDAASRAYQLLAHERANARVIHSRRCKVHRSADNERIFPFDEQTAPVNPFAGTAGRVKCNSRCTPQSDEIPVNQLAAGAERVKWKFVANNPTNLSV